jgi:peptidoglycan/xylan/chitin deacetylase (PgdA/CDA1 family)
MRWASFARGLRLSAGLFTLLSIQGVRGAPAADEARERGGMALVPIVPPPAGGGVGSAGPWGERLAGVKTRFKTQRRELALTLDLCSGAFDGRYVAYVQRMRIPTTVFVTGRWIASHPRELATLLADPLFTVENHGFLHRPASIDGKSAFGLRGTHSLREIEEEVQSNADLITALTHRAPLFYRAGGAFYDAPAVAAVQGLGYQPLGFSVADGGATYSRAQARAAILGARPGAIVLLHMNHPERGAADGAIEGLEALRQRGFRFIRLEERQLE